jgi:hypothetical protein
MTAARAWAALTDARTSRMTAVSLANEGERWARRGSGEITVRRTGPCHLEWNESGHWRAGEERPTAFRNWLRWRWDVPRGTFQLDHLRRGAGRPVRLVDLTPDGPDRFTSTVAHFCDPDRYQAEMILSDGAIELRWEVSGPGKHYSLSTIYFP